MKVDAMNTMDEAMLSACVLSIIREARVCMKSENDYEIVHQDINLSVKRMYPGHYQVEGWVRLTQCETLVIAHEGEAGYRLFHDIAGYYENHHKNFREIQGWPLNVHLKLAKKFPGVIK